MKLASIFMSRHSRT